MTKIKKARNIYGEIRSFLWSDRLLFEERKKRISFAGGILFQENKDTSILKFYSYNTESKDIQQRTFYIEELEFDNDINVFDLVEFWQSERTGGGYTLSYEYPIFRKILKINERDIKKIKISKKYKNIRKNRNTLLVPFDKFIEVKEESNKIKTDCNHAKSALELYLVSKKIYKFLNIKISGTTTVGRGDFEFIVDRFNLKTKKNKKDFQKYLSEQDTESLGQIFEKMLKQRVFPKEYRTKLDNYFIKESLEKIIKLGRRVLHLKSGNIETIEAKRVINKITKKRIGQLETVWQKFFEDYLLYLFFSYKKILPKVELKNIEDNEKKYPDFIGINHYDGVDIIEIKTHLKNVLVWDNNHKNFAFSSEMSKAMIQTINYMDGITDSKFKKTKSGKELLEYLNIDENLFRPRGIIIISSKDKICKNQNKLSDKQLKQLQRDFTKLRNSIHNIQIFTFDEVLDIAERYVENISIKQ